LRNLAGSRDLVSSANRFRHSDKVGVEKCSVLLTLKIPSICDDFCQAASFVSALASAFRAAINAVTMRRP
jgi:hypothetical protein